MRVMTVRQPWALHIIQSGKDVENRVRNIAGSYRGPVAVHAALAEDHNALRRLPGKAPNGITRVFDFGFIIGVVDLVDSHHASTCAGVYPADRSAALATRDPWLWTAAEAADERDGREFCSPWALPNEQHLVLQNPRKLARPVALRGALGLRHLADSVVAEIERVGFVHYERFVEHQGMQR